VKTTRGYSTIWAATLLFFAGFYALLVPLPQYLDSIGMSDWQIGIVLGTFGIASLIGRPLAGMAVDRIGARPVLLTGAIALIIGALGVPVTSNLLLLLVLRLLQAVGYVAFTTAGTALVIVLTPLEQRAKRLAIFGIAANMAITLAPAGMSVLLTRMPLASGFVLASMLAGCAGLLAMSVPSSTLPHPSHALIPWHLPHSLWLPMLIAGLFGAGFAAFFQYAPILAEWRGDLVAGWLYSVYGISIILTRLSNGRLFRGITGPRLLGVAAISMISGLGLIAAGPPIPILLLAIVLIAYGSGTSHPTLLAHHAALLPQTPGLAAAAFYIGFDLGIGLGSWLYGVLLQGTGIGGLYIGAALLVTLVLFLAPRLGRDEEPPHPT
jgi:predicted MFS family arabinose efflux permease